MQAGDAESAAILTPYNGQVRLIRRILKEHTGELYSKVCPLILSVTRDNHNSTPCAAYRKSLIMPHAKAPCEVLQRSHADFKYATPGVRFETCRQRSGFLRCVWALPVKQMQIEIERLLHKEQVLSQFMTTVVAKQTSQCPWLCNGARQEESEIILYHMPGNPQVSDTLLAHVGGGVLSRWIPGARGRRHSVLSRALQ